jgi:ATP/maltotriose-dependent transcriptional regulator MalT
MAARWPVVGRAPELQRIAGAMDGGSSGVVLVGGPGVGKSTLAREAIGQARQRGHRTSWAVATRSAADIPFGALAHLLPADLSAGPVLDNLLAAAAATLRPQADASPLVLVIDDAHHLDPTSAALVHHLLLNRAAFVLLTVRADESAPDAIQALMDGVLERIEVTDLRRDAVGELLERVLGSQVDVATVQRLWRRTSGNPLYLREILLAGVEHGALKAVQGVWRWDGAFVPASDVEEAVRVRLAQLTPEEQGVAQLLALGEPLELKILERLAGSEALWSLERRRLLVTHRERNRFTASLSHPLYGQAVRAGLSVFKTRNLYRSLADSLELVGGARREDLLRLASWRLGAGDPIRPDVALPAAGRALILFDYPLAERLAGAVAHAGFDATAILATATIAQGRFDEAESILAKLQSEATTDDERGRSATDRAVNLATNLGRLPAALAVLERAEAELHSPAPRDLVVAMRSWLLLCAGRLPEALESGRPLLRPDLPAPAVMFGAGSVIQSLVYQGKTGEALALIDEWEERVRLGTEGTFYDALGFTLSRGLALIFQGRLAEAESAVTPSYDRLLEGGPPWVRAVLAAVIGLAALRRGDAETAARYLREGVALLTEANTTGQLPVVLALLARCLARLGDADGANTALDGAMRARTWQRFDEGYFAEAGFWAAVARDNLRNAIEGGLAHAKELDRLGLGPQEAILLHDIARLGEPRRVADRLRELAEWCDGELVTMCANHADALARRDAGLLESVSRDFERIGMLLVAAEAAADAGHHYRNQGRQASALRAMAKARTLWNGCTGVPTPPLMELNGELPISQRERQVAIRASRGRTNREIAKELVLSVRTVENHLYHVFGKLGVESRDQLGPILEPIVRTRREPSSVHVGGDLSPESSGPGGAATGSPHR